MQRYLNQENIARSTDSIEYHPLHPFLPKGCKVLFLGSFPPQMKRWSKDFFFFYPNFINDHWRIEGQIFFGDKHHFVDIERKTFRLADIVAFLEDQGIGLFDTAMAIRRLKDNASDKFLEVVIPTDILELLNRIPDCRVIVTTGEKATETLCQSLNIDTIPKVGQHIETTDTTLGHPISLYRLPSSSRAYPLSLDKKAEAYRQMFRFAGLIE